MLMMKSLPGGSVWWQEKKSQQEKLSYKGKEGNAKGKER